MGGFSICANFAPLNFWVIRHVIQSSAVMLHHVRYGDNGVVIKLYVKYAGLKSFMVKGLGSRKALIRSAYLQPLSLLEVVFEDLPNRELLHLKETRIYHQTPSIHATIVKTAIAFFMTEVIQRSIREFEINTALFDFIENAIFQLERVNENLSTFPHWFLLRLTRFLGFQPLNNHSTDKPWFNPEAGTFTSAPPASNSSTISQAEISNELALMLSAYSSEVFSPLPLKNKKQLLETLLFYYAIHIPEFKELKSPAVFHEIFHT